MSWRFGCINKAKSKHSKVRLCTCQAKVLLEAGAQQKAADAHLEEAIQGTMYQVAITFMSMWGERGAIDHTAYMTSSVYQRRS